MSLNLCRSLCWALPFCLVLGPVTSAAPVAAPAAAEPTSRPAATQPATPDTRVVAEASDEGEEAIGRFKVYGDLKVDLFAAEPLLANPCAFHIDERGRFYVVELFRIGKVLDVRGHPRMVDDDLAARTVEDRIAMTKKHIPDWEKSMLGSSDRLRLVVDTDGDGKADHATIFTDGYDGIEEGLAAGVLARKGNVYFANMPHLWLLNDTDNDGVADQKKSLHQGYGVRFAFYGHDLHGLRMGPDGKLYFSCGDRGLNVKTDREHVLCPDSGAVLRCNPDGSDLELVHVGLRNPQELAFDEFGNLFTGDNNCDRGDPARWVYVVEGGDSGWRIGYQQATSYDGKGPWVAENFTAKNGQNNVPHIVPPIEHIGTGPSGIAYYPGTGLDESFNGRFFWCDFRGSPTSGVFMFKHQPDGAAYKVVEQDEFIWDVLPTDIDFGYDGGAYLTDWVTGWGMTGKGRIYRAYDPGIAKSAVVLETKKLMAEGFDKRGEADLEKLLEHPDMRVRQEAQFELAARGKDSIETFARTALRNENRLARLHAIWGLGQVARTLRGPLRHVTGLLADKDDEVRAQAAKVLGDGKRPEFYPAVVKALEDPNPRVRFFAAYGAGKLGGKEAVQPLLKLLEENNNKDAYLRHAAVMGLVHTNDVERLNAAAKHPSPAVRLGVLLALRRHQRPLVAQFLDDSDPQVVVAAARAVHDLPLPGAMPKLAELIRRDDLDTATRMRAINANYRLGTPEAATRLLTFSLTQNPEPMRVEALRALAQWNDPSGRDRVTSLWRPADPRTAPEATAAAIRKVLPELLNTKSDDVRVAAAVLAEQHGLEDPSLFFDLVTNEELAPRVRAGALRAMGAQDAPRLAEAIEKVLKVPAESLRREAIRQLAKLPDAVEKLREVISTGSTVDQQTVLRALGPLADPAATAILSQHVDHLLRGTLKPELHLDLMEAAAQSEVPEIREKLDKFNGARRAEDPLAGWRETLHGGDASAGRTIFFENQQVSCLRCHTIDGTGGIVGPDLSDIGARKDRDYILNSILHPNAEIAPGFESVIVRDRKKRVHAGILKSETDEEITIFIETEGLVTIKKDDVLSRRRDVSAMPEDLANGLSKQEMRDLIEFLATRKTPPHPKAQ
jgi:quinoprotein glucose dehydrogenase